jgi:CheY-like chemotaxis protein
LVVDNDKGSATLMEEVFAWQGAEVRAVSDAAAASALINRVKFDGIFLELNLEEVDGVELTRRIRQSAWNAKTPIVLVGKSDAKAVARAFKAGGTFFLSKPLKRDAVKRALISTRGVMIEERRRYGRIAVARPLQCLFGARELQDCALRNLSLGGMLFQDDGTLRPKDKVRLSFRFATGEPLIIVRAAVARADGKGTVGVRFTSISPDDRERIRKQIAREVDNR